MNEANGVVFGWFVQRKEIDGQEQEVWFNVTVRSEISPEDAIDKFFNAVVHAMTKYGATPYKPAGSGKPSESQPPQPQKPAGVTYVDIDDTGNELEQHKVTAFAHMTSKTSGKSYMRVYGEGLGEYGVPVWDNMIPKDINVEINGNPMPLSQAYKYMAVGEKQPVSPRMGIVLTRGHGKDMKAAGFKSA